MGSLEATGRFTWVLCRISPPPSQTTPYEFTDCLGRSDVLPIDKYAYELCERCFGPQDLNPSIVQLDGAVYYLVSDLAFLPDYTGQKSQYLEHLQLIAYLSDEVFA